MTNESPFAVLWVAGAILIAAVALLYSIIIYPFHK